MDNFRRASLYTAELPTNARRLEASDYNNTIIKKLYIPIVSNPLALTSDQVSLYYGNEYDNYCDDMIYFVSCNSSGGGTDLWGTYPPKRKYIDIGTRTKNRTTPSQFSISGGVEYLRDDGYEIGYRFRLFQYRAESSGVVDKYVTTLYVSDGGISLMPSEFYDEEYSLENPLYICIDSRNFVPGVEKQLPFIKATGYEQTRYSNASTGVSTTSVPKYPIYIEPA